MNLTLKVCGVALVLVVAAAAHADTIVPNGTPISPNGGNTGAIVVNPATTETGIVTVPEERGLGPTGTVLSNTTVSSPAATPATPAGSGGTTVGTTGGGTHTVPEPSTLLLISMGLLGFVGARKKIMK